MTMMAMMMLMSIITMTADNADAGNDADGGAAKISVDDVEE
jgi:hypothetical protein